MMDDGMMGWMWLWPLVLVVVLVIVGYLLVRLVNGGRPTQGTSARSSARQVLDERYARGEIDDEEYRRRRDGLG